MKVLNPRESGIQTTASTSGASRKDEFHRLTGSHWLVFSIDSTGLARITWTLNPGHPLVESGNKNQQTEQHFNNGCSRSSLGILD